MTDKTIDQALNEAARILAFCGLTREQVISFCVRSQWYPKGMTPDVMLDVMRRERKREAIAAQKIS